MTDEELKKQQQDQQGGAQSMGAPSPMQTPTFSQMQSQGIPRPAPWHRQQQQTTPSGVPQGGAPGAAQSDDQTDVQNGGTSGGGGVTGSGTGGPTTKPAPFNPAGQQFGSTLQSMFGNWKPQGEFQGQSQTTAAPTFTPGANPFQMPSGNAPQVGSGPQFAQAQVPGGQAQQVSPWQNTSSAPQAFQPGGFQGSYQAQQAPVTQLTGQFQAPNNPLGAQTTGAIQSFLSNPNGFNSDAVKQSYDYLSKNIDQNYDQGQLALKDEMAKRGLGESSINGERSNILLGNRRSAQEDLANNLMMQQAQSQTSAQQAAIQAAMGYGNQNFSQGLGAYQANAGTNQQNYSQLLGNAAFQGDQNAMQLMQNMGVQGFNNQAGQQGFQNQVTSSQLGNQYGQQNYQNQLQGATTNQGLQQGQQNMTLNALGYNQNAQQQGFQNELQGATTNQALNTNQLNNQLNVGGFNQGLANQGFQNNMQSAGFNAGQNQQQFQNQLSGYGANLAGNQQGFNQQQGLLNNLLGYEQQGFQNQLGTAQFNGSQNQWYQQLLAQIAQSKGA